MGQVKFCGRQPLKNMEGYGRLPFRFFKGCLPQTFLGPFLNTFSFDVVPQRHKYLIKIEEYRSRGYKVFDQDEMWCNANHTKEYER